MNSIRESDKSKPEIPRVKIETNNDENTSQLRMRKNFLRNKSTLFKQKE